MELALLCLTVLLLVSSQPAVAGQGGQNPGQVDLCGEWTFVNSNRTISGVGKVPGGIYTDLMRNKVLHNGDFYYRYNDVAYRWVAYDNWTYSRSFDVPADFISRKNVELWIGGLDTVASVFINNRKVGSTNNMFRRYIFDVKPVIQVGKNDIRIEFESGVLYAKAQAEAYPYPVPPKCPNDIQHGECHFNFIRKSATFYSWDWGPAFPSQGITYNITIEAYDDALIEHITIETAKGSGDIDWTVRIKTFFRVKEATTGTLGVFIPALGVKLLPSVGSLSASNPIFSLEVNISKSAGVQPWWPNGEGSQQLYDMMVIFQTSREKSERKVRIGFRTVELVQDPIEGGLTFYFKINGRPVFMKGANWIPADIFLERITYDYLHRLLYSAKAANMNMLRVDGVGIYESESFYELADELGILLFQEFTYVCALYPTNADFLNNVREEVRHQIRRLKKHPSIALWSANNENEMFLANNWFGINQTLYQRYHDDYVNLYISTIRDVLLQEDPTRPFIPSSPSNGKETEQEGWVAKNPDDPQYGDVHFYDYTSDGWSWKTFPVSRFLSEFGWQSWSSFETLQKVTIVEDRGWNSSWAYHRQHHPDGNDQMYQQIASHIRMPNTTDKSKFFEYFTYLTQVNHAMSVKTEAELSRRRQSFLDNGRGHTMGVLFWQLNDIWQAPTWASIEYGGKWKMTHYYAKSFFNRTIVSTELDGDCLKIFYVEDGLMPFEQGSGQLRDKARRDRSVINMEEYEHKIAKQTVSSTYLLLIEIYSWANLNPVKSWKVDAPLPTKASSLMYTYSVSTMLSQAPGCTKSSCFLYFTMYYDQQMSAAGPSNWQFLTYPKDAQGMKKANIQIKQVIQTGDTFDITLTSDNIAAFTWLEATGMEGYFSENGFLMIKPTMVVTFYPWTPKYTAEDLRKSLRVWSLMDIYE